MAASPSGTPLYALSPERLNGIRSPHNGSPNGRENYSRGSLPASPAEIKLGSPPRMSPTRNSDAHVQGMVARFNTLDIRDPKRDEAAIRRLELAREMAENDAQKSKEQKEEIERQAYKVREEARKMRKELEDSRGRENKVSKRLEGVMEELHRVKETHSHAQGLYEKEIRKARKEAFKSSSALVKLQEELKGTRNSLRITQSGFESEKTKAEKREKEAFDAQYKLVGVQEELQKMREQFKVLQEERDALKTNLQEEEVARIAAEGMIALPPAHNEEDEFASPKRSPRKVPQSEASGNDVFVLPARDTELDALQEQLNEERRRREQAEDTVDYMKMECQFQCCSCRVAEMSGGNYIHDDTFEQEMAKIRASAPATLTPPPTEDDTQMKDAADHPTVPVEKPATPPAEEVQFCPVTGTFRTSPSKPDAAEEKTATEDSITTSADASAVTTLEVLPPVASAPPPTSSNSLPQRSRSATPSYEPTNNYRSYHRQRPAPATNPPRTPSVARRNPSSSSHSSQHNHGHSHNHPQQRHDHQHQQQPPATPGNHFVRTITTTTTIPLVLDSPRPTSAMATDMADAATPSLSRTPSLKERPFDREAALEQIRQRRMRSRSVAEGRTTPRKQMVERRDWSAPAATQ
ncbi:hypothetical protein IWX90DRAFT_482952 [Phyllosticta citrichinensis]|uniref:Uncharacterized protein n=1 Tax=Phyllosticta citrichinensis TaxID=1130410 RepID=A0ABR1Y7Z6_9PEZI